MTDLLSWAPLWWLVAAGLIVAELLTTALLIHLCSRHPSG
jgi:hypothetical protein